MEDQTVLLAWTRSMRARNLSKVTISGYRGTLTQFINWCHGKNLTLFTVAHTDIEAWLESCRLGPRAKYAYTSRLSSLYAWLIREEITTQNPTVRVDRPKLGRHLPRPAETETVRRAMLDADPRVMTMIALGAFAGMRRFEIAQLRAEDLLLKRDPPSILIHGKGNKDRIVAINDALMLTLRRYGIPKNGYLFCGPTGHHLSPSRVGDLITGVLSSIDGHVTTHQLRHWFGTEVYAASRDLRLTQEVMGHSSPATTAIYAAFNNADAQRVVTGLALERPEDVSSVPVAEPDEAA